MGEEHVTEGLDEAAAQRGREIGHLGEEPQRLAEPAPEARRRAVDAHQRRQEREPGSVSRVEVQIGDHEARREAPLDAEAVGPCRAHRAAERPRIAEGRRQPIADRVRLAPRQEQQLARLHGEALLAELEHAAPSVAA